jgi:N-methylhydantoinase A
MNGPRAVMDGLRYRIGVDIGGTFTDIVLMSDEGAVYSKKLLSTPADYSAAIEDGVVTLLSELCIPPDRIAEFVHATTIATNTIIEHRGVKVALVTTRGFRDVLELGRFRAPRPYDSRFRKPDPLVPRRLRFEAPERIGADGSVVHALELETLEEIAQALERERVDALAICLINACGSGVHEAQAAEFFRTRLPGMSVTTSTSLLPQVGEYERTSTTVINAYIRPVVGGYVASLERRLRRLGIPAPLMIMQSSGGISPGPIVAAMPITIIESGPAAGVLGGQRMGAAAGLRDMIVFDMGGTTAKSTVIENLEFNMCPEIEVGGAASMGQRMIRGGGYPVQAPTIDIAEVGAGGGSIASVDEAGGLKVGPRSAGAEPGPVCYDRGGVQPTVTDANLVLGYLNPHALVGGELKLDFDKARQAIEALGSALDLDVTDAAYGIHALANAAMLRALRGISSERGRDPSRFPLLAIGGNGPVHAAGLAEAGGMNEIIVPPVAGLFSALGMLFADVEHHLVTGFYRSFELCPLEAINAAAKELVESGRRLLAQQGYTVSDRQHITVCADMKYVGQTSPLTVRLPAFPATVAVMKGLIAAFEQEHLKTFGYISSGDPLQFVALKAICQGVAGAPRMPERMVRGNERPSRQRERRAYYGVSHGWQATPVLTRADLAASPAAGPLIVEEYDTTVVVRPGWKAHVDDWNQIRMERVQ